MGTETVAVLFTDLVGSTELLSRLGDERADQLRQEHFDGLRAALQLHSGREVKTVGDGLMVAFANASSAIAGAVEMQQRVDARNRAGADEVLNIRVGLSYRECDVEGGDYFGRAVVEAARLCAHAVGGQILVSDVVRTLAGTRGGHGFTPFGALALKGLETPVVACVVGWAPVLPDPALATLVPVPSRLRSGPTLGFVGRGAELSRLDAMFKQAESELERRVVLVCGEAGIGKTSLVGEHARDAHERGAVVLYGRCDEELGIPYQPWGEALGHLVAHLPSELLADHVSGRGSELARIVPALTERTGALPGSRSADPEAERYMLFAAVVGLLASVSSIAPVVVVLDDLHWADKPSLLLLRHVASTDVPMRVHVLATYRATDLAVGHPLADLLASLHREAGTERLELAGLDDGEVVELLERATGYALDQQGVDFAHALYRETDGNPFFTAEILRHLAETGAILRHTDGRWSARLDFRGDALPSSTREVIGRRVARLGQPAEQALRAAAVIGRDFDLPLLGRVTDVDEATLLDVMDAAARSALVAEVASDRFTFEHALVEHTLYEDLSASRRARLHRRVAEAIEAACGADPGDRVGELAYHWARATAPKEPRKAVDYARHAGDRALARLAPDEAVRWYSQALELFDHDFGDEHDIIDLSVRLGDAQRQAGDASYRTTLLEAANRARDAHAPELLVRAALANSRGFFSAIGRADAERIGVLEEASAITTGVRTHDRARLLALLAQELVPTGGMQRRRALADEALAIARDLDDPATLLQVLNLRFNAVNAAASLPERLATTAEAMTLARRLEDPVARLFAEMFRAFAALDAGDRDELNRAAHGAIILADEVRQPVPEWVATWERTLLRWLDGDLPTAERYAVEALSIGLESGQPDAALIPGALLLDVRWAQGRAEELEPLALQLINETPNVPTLHAAIAVIYTEHKRFQEARRVLDTQVSSRFSSRDSDPYALATSVLWAHAVADLDHAVAADLLLPDLLPYREQIGAAGVIVTGTAAAAIGQLQTVLGHLDAADAAFAEATDAAQRLRCPFLVALTQCSWSRMLLRRDERGDHAHAVRLLDAALQAANTYGFAGIARRAEALHS